MAIDIFRLCLEKDIQIDTQWILREANLRADLLTRFVDKDDWSVNSEVLAQLDCKWGQYSIDRFASHYIAQDPKFNFKFMSPGCSAFDAFSLIGEERIIGFALLFPWLWMRLKTRGMPLGWYSYRF